MNADNWRPKLGVRHWTSSAFNLEALQQAICVKFDRPLNAENFREEV
jgi:hypothetical protein